MRIGIDAHVFDEKFQGSRTYLEGLYHEAIRLRPDWHFFFFAKDVVELKSAFGSSDNVHYIPLTSTNKYARLLFEFPRLLKKHAINLAHFQYISPPFISCEYFVTTHDILFLEPRFKKYFPWKYRFLNGFLFKRSAKRASWVLTVSEYSKQKIVAYFNLSPSRVYVTPNAVQEPSIEVDKGYIKSRFGIEKYLLYVSRVEPRKNHLSLLEAYVRLRLNEKGYSLVFIGSKDLPYPAMDSFLEKHKEELQDTFFHFPGLSGEELQQFYANAEVFVYPSLAEGFGIPPLEAAIFDVPVICSNATAMKDFNFFQYHIDPMDSQSLEGALTAVLHEKDSLKSVKETIHKRYSWMESARVLIHSVAENCRTN